MARSSRRFANYQTSARQDQAHPVGWREIKEFVEGAGESLRAGRETLARRGRRGLSGSGRRVE